MRDTADTADIVVIVVIDLEAGPNDTGCARTFRHRPAA